ncbi:fumarylacetoacetate hydrolase family protein [Desulfonema magnum]|uniref:Fumarylacetoacetate hydrolase domain-containing protein n=1 Tax=Desulfonema magnum TaxID=45655 RepID=A0A975BXP4_9BACT|nr:fumarylacetoacetate hydrolase family protein [Desulfonema magnum]QTA93085.1 Fumarylacetoacetate hydrolase domain-containing protein [Desulfonema magnum]
MRIIRFLDENNNECYGYNYHDDIATPLKGELFGGQQAEDTGPEVRVKKLLAPLQPTAILCIGLNYRQHAKETGIKLPDYPVLFMKNPAAVTHPGDPVVLPPSCLEPPQVDYEAELVVVIGKPAKDVSAKDALDYVLGYTAANDVSARRWQKHAGGGQWVRGKSFDTFCPLGPELVTADEIPDPQTLRLRCILNNEVMQDSNTSDMIFSVAELIEFLSESTTLLPGTVILTGTPSGVGFVREPPVYLKSGDVVEISVEGIGSLSNPVA